MFGSLKVQNFRAIGPSAVSIDLAPVTVLVGENGTGKSSLLEALALTAQSATEESQRTDLVLSGSRVQYPGDPGARETYRRLYFRGDAFQPLSVGFDVQLSKHEWDQGGLPASPPPMMELGLGWPPSRIGFEWTRREQEWPYWTQAYSLEGREIFRLWTERTRADSGWSMENFVSFGLPDQNPSMKKLRASRPPERLLGERLFMSLARDLLVEKKDEVVLSLAEPFLRTIRDLSDLLRRKLGGVALLTPLRGRQLMDSTVGPPVEFVGSHGSETIRLLASLQARTNPRFQELKRWAQAFGLPDIESGILGDGLKIAFRDPQSGVQLSLDDAATGSIQALTIATQVLLARPGSTLLIEEPENNLHPAYEKLLPSLFADAVRAGNQIVASSHSEVLVAALGNAVRKGDLSRDQVVVWHLERSPQGVSANRIDVSDKGYLKGWVSSFARVEEELFREWADRLPQEGDDTRR